MKVIEKRNREREESVYLTLPIIYNRAETVLDTGKKVRRVLLAKVVVGNGKRLQQDALTLTAPPDGCDSVLGEVKNATVGNLNHDEVVVYREDACLPRYVFCYVAP